FEIFSEESKHTKEHLFDLLTSVLCLNGFQSVKYCFDHFIENVSDNKLKSYYFTLNESKIDPGNSTKKLSARDCLSFTINSDGTCLRVHTRLACGCIPALPAGACPPRANL
ncbi:MAG: hypothetical protein IIY78_07860, partial [Clostridia bacterium]|nr:hypothetical protein [Clostridia bacterium]